MTGRATIADVARAAGVSTSTASVVFSGKAAVAQPTRSRVLAAARSLGYAGPDPRAASLRRGRSGIVGVVTGGRLGQAFVDPVTTVMLDALADELHGAGLLLVPDHADGPSLLDAPVDAAVLLGCSPRLRRTLPAVAARGIPIVVIEGDAGRAVPRIRLDNRRAQARIAEHLREIGHRDIVTVTLPLEEGRQAGWADPDREAITLEVAAERLAGVRDVFPHARVYSAGASLVDEGYAAGRAVFASGAHPPTAVIAQSDLLAVGVVRAAQERGLRVPEDVSVTGFDGIRADGIAPLALTTMAQPAAEKGERAGAALAAMLAGRPVRSVTLASRFVPGSTTAPPAGPPC